MGLIACPVLGKKKSSDLCSAFIAGAPKHATGAVFYGVDDSNHASFVKCVRNQIPYYYIDNSYFDSVRGTQFRVTCNALQVRAMQCESDGKRFDALGLEIKPAQINSEGHWIIVEQSPSFMRFVGAPNWFHNTLLWAERTGRDVRVRRWHADKPKLQASLQRDLEGAWGLLSHTSAAAITAMLEGIPALVESTHAVAHVAMSSDNSMDSRRHAFNVLADHQFTVTEMKEGLAWAALHK